MMKQYLKWHEMRFFADECRSVSFYDVQNHGVKLPAIPAKS